MAFGLLAGVLAVTAKPGALDLTAQTGKGAKDFQLKGKHSRQQLVATTIDAGKPADLSRAVKYSSTPKIRALALAQGLELPHIIRDPQLSFSTFLINLGDDLKTRHPELDINDV